LHAEGRLTIQVLSDLHLETEDFTPLPAPGADLLVHEATFSAEEGDKAEQTGHCTAAAAATLARDAGVRRLVLTHISARYSREAPELAAEAQAIFPESTVARDGLVVDVPFPDAGA